MNGAGFKCDQCGKAVIVPMPSGYRSSPGEVPVGWFYLLGPQPGKEANGSMPSTPELHLCSVACVAGWAHNALAAPGGES